MCARSLYARSDSVRFRLPRFQVPAQPVCHLPIGAEKSESLKCSFRNPHTHPSASVYTLSPGATLKSLRLSPPTAGAQMVRAAGQGHGRNDAATTDPQPRARCSSYAHDTQAVRHFAWGGRANGNQLVPQAEANVVSQNLLVSTSRKEISWCNKARLRGASTSRARAKVWAQLPGAGPRAWGPPWRRGGSQLNTE